MTGEEPSCCLCGVVEGKEVCGVVEGKVEYFWIR